jgi:hypothetical protein
MHLIFTRKYPFIDTLTLVEREARDSLFRIDGDEFLLHMTSECELGEDRLIWFDARSALLWLNQEPDEYGSHWQ